MKPYPFWLTLIRWSGLILVAPAVFIFTAEIMLRVFYFGPDAIAHFFRYTPLDCSRPYFLVLSDDERIAVERRRNHQWFFLGAKRKTNSLGLYERMRSEEELKNNPTMVVMGESFAESAGVEMEKGLSARLENYVRQYRPCNVVDMSLTNTVLESQIEWFKQKVMPVYRPKWVLLAFLANGKMSGKVQSRDLWRVRIEMATKFWPLWKRSFALFIIHDYWTNIHWNPYWFEAKLRKWSGFSLGKPQGNAELRSDSNANSGTEKPLSDKVKGMSVPESQVSPEALRTARLLRDLKELGQEQGFQVIVSPLSHLKELDNPGRDSADRRELKRVTEELGIPYVETFPFLDGEDPRYCILWASNRHPNEYCYDRIAKNLARVLEKRHLLEIGNPPEKGFLSTQKQS